MTRPAGRRTLAFAALASSMLLFETVALGQTPPADQPDPKTLFEQGNAAFDEGHIEEAVVLYRSALTLVVPIEHPEILRNLVVATRALGREDESLVYFDMLTAMGAEVPRETAGPPAASRPPPPVQKAVSVFPLKGRSWTWKDLYRSRIGHWYGWVGKYTAYLVAVVVFVIGASMSFDGDDGPGCLLVLVGLVAAFLGGWLL